MLLEGNFYWNSPGSVRALKRVFCAAVVAYYMAELGLVPALCVMKRGRGFLGEEDRTQSIWAIDPLP